MVIASLLRSLLRQKYKAMKDTMTSASSQYVTDTGLRSEAWAHARKRADDYLKLHRLPTAEHEQLLTQVAQKLTRAAPCDDQALIQLFISTVQQELVAQQAQARTQTGPRFERSSIRVAPLRAIPLLPRSLQA